MKTLVQYGNYFLKVVARIHKEYLTNLLKEIIKIKIKDNHVMKFKHSKMKKEHMEFLIEI